MLIVIDILFVVFSHTM